MPKVPKADYDYYKRIKSQGEPATTPSTWSTMGRAFKDNFVPSTVGGAAGFLLPARLPFKILGGMAAGIGAGLGQESARRQYETDQETEARTKVRQLDVDTNPKSYIAGELASGALFGGPNPKNLVAPLQLLARSQRTPEVLRRAGQAAIGGGLMTGIEGVNQAIRGDLDISTLLSATAGGALMSGRGIAESALAPKINVDVPGGVSSRSARLMPGEMFPEQEGVNRLVGGLNTKGLLTDPSLATRLPADVRDLLPKLLGRGAIEMPPSIAIENPLAEVGPRLLAATRREIGPGPELELPSRSGVLRPNTRVESRGEPGPTEPVTLAGRRGIYRRPADEELTQNISAKDVPPTIRRITQPRGPIIDVETVDKGPQLKGKDVGEIPLEEEGTLGQKLMFSSKQVPVRKALLAKKAEIDMADDPAIKAAMRIFSSEQQQTKMPFAEKAITEDVSTAKEEPDYDELAAAEAETASLPKRAVDKFRRSSPKIMKVADKYLPEEARVKPYIPPPLDTPEIPDAYKVPLTKEAAAVDAEEISAKSAEVTPVEGAEVLAKPIEGDTKAFLANQNKANAEKLGVEPSAKQLSAEERVKLRKLINQEKKFLGVLENRVGHEAYASSQDEVAKQIAHYKKTIASREAELKQSTVSPEKKASGGLKTKPGQAKRGKKSEAGFLEIEPILELGTKLYAEFKKFPEWAAEVVKKLGTKSYEVLRRIYDHISAQFSGASYKPSPDWDAYAKSVTDGPTKFSIPALRSSTDALQATAGRPGKYMASKLKDVLFFSNARSNALANRMLETAKSKLSPVQRDVLLKLLHAERHEGRFFRTAIADDPKMVKAYDEIREGLKWAHVDQRAHKQPVVGVDGQKRLPLDDPYYFPELLSMDVIRTLTKDSLSPESENLRKIFIDYYITENKRKFNRTTSKETAEAEFQKIADLAAAPNKGTIAYGATRKAEGVGLPPEFREQNIVRVIERYAKRYSTDRAFYDYAESDPIFRTMLQLQDPWSAPGAGNTDPKWLDNFPDSGEKIPKNMAANQHVIAIMDYLGHKANRDDVVFHGFEQVANAFILGPGTSLTDTMSSVPIILSYTKNKEEALEAVKSFKHLTSSWSGMFKEAKEAGFIRSGVPLSQQGHEALRVYKQFKNIFNEHGNTITDIAEMLNNLSRVLLKVSGREDGEIIARTLVWGTARSIAGVRIAKAYQGDADSIKSLVDMTNGRVIPFLKRGDPIPAELSQEITHKISNQSQTTYDPASTPAALQDSHALTSTFRLSRWSIGQLNQFNREIIDPLIKEGRLDRALYALLGATVAGPAVIMAREMLNGKKGPTPSIAELAAGSETDLLDMTHKWATMVNATGFFGGFLMDLAKMPLDIMVGQNAREMNVPVLDLLVSQGVEAATATKAILQGEIGMLDGAVKLMRDTAIGSSQLGRIIGNQVVNNEEAKLKDMYRDFAVYKRLEDINTSVSSYNRFDRYSNFYQQKFKSTTDEKEATELFEKIASQIEGIKDDDRYADAVKGLKVMPINILPSIKSPEFEKYIQYIRKTQGQDRVVEIMDHYESILKANAMKKALIKQRLPARRSQSVR